MRRLLTHLVALGDGTADTRRRVERRELDDHADSAATVDSILERFGAARLLTFDHDRLTRQPTVEIAHDALIAEWGRLAAWVDEDRADLVLARQIAVAARSWIVGGRDDSDLYRGLRLDAAISWSERRPGEGSPDTPAFLDAGTAMVRREAEEQRDRAEHRRRQQRRLVRLAAAATVAAVLAVTAGGVATIQSRRADDARAVAEDARAVAEVARDRSEVDRLVAQAIADADDSPARSMLLAAAAYDLAPSAETAGAMQSAIVARPRGFVGFIPSGGETAQVEIGSTVIVRHTSDEVEIIDRMDRDVRLVIPDPTDNTRFALSADDRWLALAGPTIRVFDAASGSLIAELARSPRSTVVAFDPTAPSRLAIGFDDGSAEIVQWASEEVETRVAAQGDQVVALVFSPNGRQLATSTGARESALRVWDSQTGAPITDNLGVAGTALYHRDLSFDSTGRLLVSVDRGGVGRVWSIPGGEPITQTEITYGVEALNAVEFIDETSIVASGPSGVLRFWSAVDGKELETVEPHAGLVTSLAVDPLRRLLVVGGNDQLSLFDLDGISPGRDIDPFPDEMREALGTGGPVNASISADGRVLAAVTPSGVWLWHRGGEGDGARLLPPSASTGIVIAATVSPDGSLGSRSAVAMVGDDEGAPREFDDVGHVDELDRADDEVTPRRRVDVGGVGVEGLCHRAALDPFPRGDRERPRGGDRSAGPPLAIPGDHLVERAREIVEQRVARRSGCARRNRVAVGT